MDTYEQFINTPLLREISLLKYLKHDNIISIVDYHLDIKNQDVKIIFEFYGLSLISLINNSNSPKVIKKTIVY